MCAYMYTYTYMHMYMCLASLRSAFRAHPIGYPPRTVLIEPVVEKWKTGLGSQPKDAEKLCPLGPSPRLFLAFLEQQGLFSIGCLSLLQASSPPATGIARRHTSVFAILPLR